MRALALLLVVVAGGGCYTMRAELPGVLRDDVQPAERDSLGPLVVEKKHWFLLDGLLGRPPADLLADDIKAAVQRRGGDGVAGLRYESEQSCGDAAIGACTLGCLVPRTYRVSGTVVRIRAPRLPGRPAKLVDARTAAAARIAQAY
jgi:hypothetical protein